MDPWGGGQSFQFFSDNYNASLRSASPRTSSWLQGHPDQEYIWVRGSATHCLGLIVEQIDTQTNTLLSFIGIHRYLLNRITRLT